MTVEILAIHKQVRFRVLTDMGEYQDALYYPADEPLDDAAVTVEAHDRAVAWMQAVRNTLPVEALPAEVLQQQLVDLDAQTVSIDAQKVIVQDLLDASGLIAGDDTPPSVPKYLTAEIMKTWVELTWEASSDDVSLAGYNVFRDDVLLAQSGVNHFSDCLITADSSYTYTVSAFDHAGHTSDLSEPVTIAIPTTFQASQISLASSDTDTPKA